MGSDLNERTGYSAVRTVVRITDFYSSKIAHIRFGPAQSAYV